MGRRSTVSDEDVVRSLALYERAAGALLELLRRDPDPDADPAPPTDRAHRAMAALTNAALPDPATWSSRSLDDRCEWWISRISNVTALLPAAPRALGVLADRIPGTAVLGATVSGMAVLAVAQEYGMTDAPDRVALLATILTDRSPQPATVSAITANRARLDARLAELLRLDEVRAAHGPRRLWLIAGSLRRLSHVVEDIEDVLDDRPRGRLAARAVAKLPAIGVVGGYFAERKAIERAAAQTRRELDSITGGR